MGNSIQRQLGTQLPPDPRSYIQYDLPKFQVQGRLGDVKFMKSYHMRVDGVSLVVKVYVKSPDEDEKELQTYASRLTNLWKIFSPIKHPYLLPYQMWIKSNTKLPKSSCTPVYLIRQYFISNLYERLSTRPFLLEIEKLWIIYQLLRAIEVIHNYNGIIHGDIKLENIMITSWNWLVLTDFASFKPTTLPNDDPTNFQYFFDMQGNNRERCSVAPERFYNTNAMKNINTTSSANTSSKVSTDASSNDSDNSSAPNAHSMDVFSCGCAIAEV